MDAPNNSKQNTTHKMKNETNKDDWWMKEPKWYAIGNAIMPLVLLGLWITILTSILFGL